MVVGQSDESHQRYLVLRNCRQRFLIPLSISLAAMSVVSATLSLITSSARRAAGLLFPRLGPSHRTNSDLR